ncbi:MAG TPA: AMP-binding protein [Acidimicrobiales bacterium]|nr:AMP-binding protein [Acidimicrobiales bacterium]
MSLADLLFGPGALAEGPAALVHAGGVAYTADEVRARAEAVAAAVGPAGVAGRAVGVMLPDGVDVVAALFGVWRAGGVYVPLNPRLTDGEVGHVLAALDPAAVVTTAEHRERFAGRPVHVMPGGGRAAGGAVRAGGGEGGALDPDAALVQFTSGTTGRPKPVVLTHTGVLTLLDNVVAKLRGGGRVPAGEPMPNLVPVSLSLWAGIYNVLFALRVGAPVVILGRFDPLALVALVKQFGIRSTVLPPAAMAALVDDERVTDLAPLRYVRSITAPLSPLQARRFRDRFGIAVLNSYGQTEIGGEIVGWTAADSREHGDAKLGSVGRPHAGVEVRVDGATGELQVRTPALAAGYAGGDSGGGGGDLADRLTADGWFRTGDVGRVDGDGFVWIEGRLSDMINRGGLKVAPAEVEEVLRTSPEVADAAVVGLPDHRLGEVPVAFVVAATGLAPTSDGLSGLCRAHLAPYKVPVRFEIVDALPRNEVGKVLRSVLRGNGR